MAERRKYTFLMYMHVKFMNLFVYESVMFMHSIQTVTQSTTKYMYIL